MLVEELDVLEDFNGDTLWAWRGRGGNTAFTETKLLVFVLGFGNKNRGVVIGVGVGEGDFGWEHERGIFEALKDGFTDTNSIVTP